MNNNDNEPAGPRWRVEARRAIEDRVVLTGYQVSDATAARAAGLLSCLWRCGERHGVNPLDWRHVTSLEQIALDAAVITEQPGNH